MENSKILNFSISKMYFLFEKLINMHQINISIMLTIKLFIKQNKVVIREEHQLEYAIENNDKK